MKYAIIIALAVFVSATQTPPPTEKRTSPIVIGDTLVSLDIITRVEPVYPATAREARVEGTVVLKATIGKDGTVSGISVVQGHPLLNDAAIDAFKQWRYKPARLNGETVEFMTTVALVFRLPR